ncbi:ABC transporter substrate-binding protein [Candidatus Gracilibacteria bacterium]|nr:ABC transporter substrate-binding protein [Candidatus Gracilibacteria bacterium]
MKKILLGLGLSLFLFGCESATQNTPSSEEEVLRIGAVNPLTGEATAYGDQTMNITNMVVEEINNTGGINGKKIEIIWEDGKCTGKDGSLAAQKLINVDKVNIMLVSCSMEVLGVAPITENREVLVFSTLATNPSIRDAGDFVFRSTPSDSSQGQVLAEYADAHFPKIGIISEQTDYAIGVTDTFVKHFNGEVLREDFLSSESDFKTRITKLKNSGVDALFLSPQTPTKFEILIKQLQEQNWDKPILVNDAGAGDLTVVRKYPEFLTNVELVGANFIAPSGPELDALLEKYQTKYGTDPRYISYAASTADGIHMLAQALETVDDVSDTHKIRDALYNIKDFHGLLGILSIDDHGEVNITHSLFRFDGENFVPLEE